MAELLVNFEENGQSFSGILINADIKETKIRTLDGKIHTVDSELVTLKNVDVDTPFAIEWLDTFTTHYQGCEITDVESSEIDLAVNYIKKYLPLPKPKKDYDLHTALNGVNKVMSEIDVEENKETLGNVQQFMETQQSTIEALQKEIEELKTKPVIVISTPFGNICATESSDPNYPGIFIDVEDGEGNQENASIVEYCKNENKINVHAYKQGSEDSIESYKWNENQLTKIFKPKER